MLLYDYITVIMIFIPAAVMNLTITSFSTLLDMWCYHDLLSTPQPEQLSFLLIWSTNKLALQTQCPNETNHFIMEVNSVKKLNKYIISERGHSHCSKTKTSCDARVASATFCSVDGVGWMSLVTVNQNFKSSIKPKPTKRTKELSRAELFLHSPFTLKHLIIGNNC